MKEQAPSPLVEEVDNKSEVVAPAVRSEYKVETVEVEKKKSDAQAYVAAQAGMVNYSDASNVRANGAGGVKVGYVTANHIVIEGGFLYSNFNIEQQGFGTFSNYPPYSNMDQYNMTAAVKYQLLSGTFRPYVGRRWKLHLP